MAKDIIAERILKKKPKKHRGGLWILFVMIVTIAVVLLGMSWAKQQLHKETISSLEQETKTLQQTVLKIKSQYEQAKAEREKQEAQRDQMLSRVKRNQVREVTTQPYTFFHPQSETLPEGCFAFGPLLDQDPREAIDPSDVKEEEVQSEIARVMGEQTEVFVQGLQTLAESKEASLLQLCRASDKVVYALGMSDGDIVHVFSWETNEDETQVMTARFVADVFFPEGAMFIDASVIENEVVVIGYDTDADGAHWNVYRVDFATNGADLIEECLVKQESADDGETVQLECKREYVPTS